MSPSKVALSTSRQTQKTTANFQEGPPKGRPGFTFARAGFGQGGAECRFHLPATRSHVSKYRDPQRNLRNRRMTSFIDHVATINLIWFSAEQYGWRRELTVLESCARDYPAVPLFRKHIVHVCYCAANDRCQLPFICGTFICIYVGSVSHRRASLSWQCSLINTYELPLIIIINNIHTCNKTHVLNVRLHARAIIKCWEIRRARANPRDQLNV